MEKYKLIPSPSKDIAVSRFDENSFYVHVENYGYRLKLSKESYDLLLLANGRNNLGDIQKHYSDDLTIDFLFDFFYSKLAKYGIIENSETKVIPIGKPSYLKLSFIVLPPKIVDLVTPYFKFLFAPKLMRILLFFMLFFLSWVSYINYSTILSINLSEFNWFYFGLLGFISVTFHEFGHASSAAYFGAKHGGIGGGFYLFTPVYFADVSDIWKLSRQKRIVVNLAGVYFESIISCLYILFGLLINNDLFVIIGIFIFYNSLWNLNPFLRNDGYWVLSDGLNYPNLRKNSLLLLQDFVQSIFKKSKINYSLKNIFLVIYALLNQSFIFIFLFYSINHYGMDLLKFPYNLYKYIRDIFVSDIDFNITSLLPFFIPFLFYYISIKFLKDLAIRLLKRETRHKPE